MEVVKVSLINKAACILTWKEGRKEGPVLFRIVIWHWLASPATSVRRHATHASPSMHVQVPMTRAAPGTALRQKIFTDENPCFASQL